MTEVYAIPGHVTGHYDDRIDGMIDTWESLMVSLEDFKSTVFDIGIDFAIKNQVTTWIVDSSNGQGVYKKEVQEFVERILAPKCSSIGIKYFFVVLPQSALGKLSAKKVASINAEQLGMQTIEVSSVKEALNLLEEINKEY